MVERFFSVKQQNCSTSEPITLLCGPPSSGKTSLLFQFAINAALEHDNHRPIVFLCNRTRLQTKPPYLSQGIEQSSLIFSKIHIKYIDYQSLINYLAAFHLHSTASTPIAVILDDFPLFFDSHAGNPRSRDLAMVRVLALSHNAITHANQTSPCKLLISDTQYGDGNGDTPRLLYLYKRWVSSFFTITGYRSGSGSFLLKNNIYAGSTGSGRFRTAKYSIALQYLVLEGITEDGEH